MCYLCLRTLVTHVSELHSGGGVRVGAEKRRPRHAAPTPALPRFAGEGAQLRDPARYNHTSPITAEIADPSRMPSFACSVAGDAPNASSAINSDIVKPMPASQAAPSRCFHATPLGKRAIPSLTATQ